MGSVLSSMSRSRTDGAQRGASRFKALEGKMIASNSREVAAWISDAENP
jgi:hypothetical protein